MQCFLKYTLTPDNLSIICQVLKKYTHPVRSVIYPTDEARDLIPSRSSVVYDKGARGTSAPGTIGGNCSRDDCAAVPILMK